MWVNGHHYGMKQLPISLDPDNTACAFSGEAD
jgi:hypothetical protein